MIICKVVGHVWATKKEDSLNGLKLMVVREIENKKSCFVAVDMVGSGIGEQVLVVSGSTARYATGKENCAADAAIVGIIDSLNGDQELFKPQTKRR